MKIKSNLATVFDDKITRRHFVQGAVSAGAFLTIGGSPLSFAQTKSAASKQPEVLSGNHFELTIGYASVNFTGQQAIATTVNGSVPGPILRWKEGETVSVRVYNHLHHDSSIHWHGLILPSGMDGVPGLSFDGIKPGEYFDYTFLVKQNGSYWYHSHSGFQEQTGVYGAIIIEPANPDPVSYDRDYVIQLSDWSDKSPEKIFKTLKKRSDYYNFNQRTASDIWRDIKEKGVANSWAERRMWNNMRMSQSDISDVTAYAYTYLMNGNTPEQGWNGVFKRGEKIRLRFINSAAMTIFDVRIPGLTMIVVAADGQNIEPISVDEFRIGVAETYDVIVTPSDDSAYCVFAQSIDRGGFCQGTLSPNPEWQAEIPKMDPAPLLSHRDMGMANHLPSSSNASSALENIDHSGHDMPAMNRTHTKHQHHENHLGGSLIAPAGMGSRDEIIHSNTERGPHVDMRAVSPADGIHDPGIGLRKHMSRYGRRVLRYSDLKNLYKTTDLRDPEREIQLHLTGNMARYMWSINGQSFADAEPLIFKYGERIRVVLVNDSMMTHPIHLHGVWSELETGDPLFIPKKHTILVQPGSKISYLVTADALGRWAYHCHLLYHMPSMMREVHIIDGGLSS
ncbi:Copper resistance protein A [Zhongshania aliphaticivorans]|uniref:Copper resistance protein A n=1 Tax=Zhongshania aliphaticivorans TaxID=1470434 RepID=A0A5S9NEQ8_9GAMM|nr:copper resistance system multicopper oxidase [Zhongshania aliphaticivorans]CAA0088846.1 Copper resistance protein A [Zhongshania aliphaticivorans]CAA0095262.1 Copper resistance protein A [Zhongshania aliphaticivorans]